MGGSRSGRRFHWGARQTVSDMLQLDVRRLARDDLLRPGLRYSWRWSRRTETTASINVEVERDRIILDYRARDAGGEWEKKKYPVHLEETACNLGGARTWFQCSCCGSRVALLYGGHIFACRSCHGLAYPSQRENVCDRAARRADRIRERLGWEPGILNGHGPKPKGMHQKTYDRLVREHDRWVRTSCAAMLDYLRHVEGLVPEVAAELRIHVGG